MPGYLERQDDLKALGIDEVLFFCVNDGAVMEAWAESQNIEGSMITFLADPASVLTKALDMVLDHPGPMSVLGNPRCKRFAIYTEDGVIKVWNVSERDDDPAGDEDPSAVLPDAMIASVKAIEPSFPEL